MIGKSRVQEQLDRSLTHAEKTQEKEINADGKRLAKETQRAARLAAARPGLRPRAGDGRQAAVQRLQAPRRSAASLQRRCPPAGNHSERISVSDQPDTLAGTTADDGQAQGRDLGPSTGNGSSLPRETVAKAIAALVIVSSFVEGWRHVREVASVTRTRSSPVWGDAPADPPVIAVAASPPRAHDGAPSGRPPSLRRRCRRSIARISSGRV